jgi:hypothetical protein
VAASRVRGEEGRGCRLASRASRVRLPDPAQCTIKEVGWLQSPSPFLVTALNRNVAVAPAVSPGAVVLDCKVLGAPSHVLPASVLYCHSYEARCAAEWVTRFTPECPEEHRDLLPLAGYRREIAALDLGDGRQNELACRLALGVGTRARDDHVVAEQVERDDDSFGPRPKLAGGKVVEASRRLSSASLRLGGRREVV